MSNFCSIVIGGRLGKDPELKETANGVTICSGSIAHDDGYGDRKKTCWNRFVAFGKTAEFIGGNFAKGASIVLVGRLADDTYDNKDGTTRYGNKVVAEQAYFSGPKEEGGARPPKEQEDIPF